MLLEATARRLRGLATQATAIEAEAAAQAAAVRERGLGQKRAEALAERRTEDHRREADKRDDLERLDGLAASSRANAAVPTQASRKPGPLRPRSPHHPDNKAPMSITPPSDIVLERGPGRRSDALPGAAAKLSQPAAPGATAFADAARDVGSRPTCRSMPAARSSPCRTRPR